MRRCWLFIFASLTAATSYASLGIPRELSSDNRKVALDILGSSTMTKAVADPYALGGYSGFEVSLGLEQIDTSDLFRLGNGSASPQSAARYWLVTLGKGLFYNVDFFVNFAPLRQEEDFSSFGGAVRWGFYQMTALPVYFSAQVGANSSSFQNLINTSTQTADLLMGYDLVDLSLYGGIGVVRASAIFIGGAGGVTSDRETHTESTTNNHYFAGLSYRIGKVFAAFQYDYVSTNVFSAKIGLRY